MECSLFSGKAIKEARFIQVDTRRSASHMTSHELSHVLLDQDGHSSVSGNLINFGPDVGDKELTPSQCQQIRDNIINLYRFPEALREYNLTIGRSQPAPTPPPVFDATVEFPRSAVSATRQYTCCEVDGVVRSTMPIACDPGSAHPKKDCEVCCVTAVSGTSFGHSLVPPTECTGLITSIEECALVCCGKGQPAARAVCVAEGRTIESDVAADCQDIF
jgi:hypothetical protein